MALRVISHARNIASFRAGRLLCRTMLRHGLHGVVEFELPTLGRSMRRREFIGLVGGAVAARPLGVSAQQPDRMRRIGVLISSASDDPVAQARVATFLQGLRQLGWTDGRTVRIDTLWVGNNADDGRKYAAELIALAPEVILSGGSLATTSLLQATRAVPIVFAQVTDPVGAGRKSSLWRCIGLKQCQVSPSIR
jgi:ABC-type uncharacterized transport system substrate-binding protein